MFVFLKTILSGVARLPGWTSRPGAHPEDQNVEVENEETLSENGRKYTATLGKIEKMFLSWPPGSGRLATALTDMFF